MGGGDDSVGWPPAGGESGYQFLSLPSLSSGPGNGTSRYLKFRVDSSPPLLSSNVFQAVVEVYIHVMNHPL